LSEAVVHVWRVDLRGDHAALAQHLSPQEREQAGRFVRPQDQECYTISHAALRDILGRHLQAPPPLEFRVGPQGKPSVGTGGWEFNLSHSGRCALVAVSWQRTVGVDVEWIRHDVEILSIADRFFTAAESAELHRLSALPRTQAFFRLWTRKEAYMKATGLGMSLEPTSFEVWPALRVPVDRAAALRWSLSDLEPGEGYAGALVAAAPAVPVQLWDWSP
jgi:4'-phosphopantetheinyl transferase